MTAVRGLLHRCIDYAGLFPPAALDLKTTVRNFEAYRSGADAWALGRLVLPAAMLSEFAQRWPVFAREWPVSVLLSENFEPELQVAEAARIPLDVVEARIGNREVAELRRRLPVHATVFIEVPLDGTLHERLEEIREADYCAKVRTGGTVEAAIPTSASLAQFIAGCARHGCRFKATAGLHHAIAGEHRLTYAPASSRTRMHGFLNVLLASSMLFRGAAVEEAERLLEDGSASAFSANGDELHWGEWSSAAQEIFELRERFFMGFGSCSFTEPLEELRSMGWTA